MSDGRKSPPPDGPGDAGAPFTRHGERVATGVIVAGTKVLGVVDVRVEKRARVEAAEGPFTTIRGVEVPHVADADVVHWPTVLAIVGQLRARAERLRADQAEDQHADPADELDAFADRLERKAQGK